MLNKCVNLFQLLNVSVLILLPEVWTPWLDCWEDSPLFCLESLWHSVKTQQMAAIYRHCCHLTLTTFIAMTAPDEVRYTVPSPAWALWVHRQVGHSAASVSLVLWVFARPLCSPRQVSPPWCCAGNEACLVVALPHCAPRISERQTSHPGSSPQSAPGLRVEARGQGGRWVLQLAGVWPLVRLSSNFQKNLVHAPASGPYSSPIHGRDGLSCTLNASVMDDSFWFNQGCQKQPS